MGSEPMEKAAEEWGKARRLAQEQDIENGKRFKA